MEGDQKNLKKWKKMHVVLTRLLWKTQRAWAGVSPFNLSLLGQLFPLCSSLRSLALTSGPHEQRGEGTPALTQTGRDDGAVVLYEYKNHLQISAVS